MENDMINYLIAIYSYFMQIVKSGASVDASLFYYPEGGVVRIMLSETGESGFHMQKKSSASEAFEEIKLNRFISCSDYSKVHFSGTNIMDNGDELIIIKDDNPKGWTLEAAREDMMLIMKGGHNA